MEKTIDNWGIIQHSISSIYTAPEVKQYTYHLRGNDVNDNKEVMTSKILRFNSVNCTASTLYSVYKLQIIDPIFAPYLADFLKTMESSGVIVS